MTFQIKKKTFNDVTEVSLSVVELTLLPQPRELHEAFTIRPLVSYFILGFSTQEALASHRTPVDAVVSHWVDDEVIRRFVTWGRHVAVSVLSRARVRQVDATLLFN